MLRGVYDTPNPEFSQNCGTRRDAPFPRGQWKLEHFIPSHGSKTGSKEKAYVCLEVEDILQAMGPVVLKSCCHQKHQRSFLKIGNLGSTPHTWTFQWVGAGNLLYQALR